MEILFSFGAIVLSVIALSKSNDSLIKIAALEKSIRESEALAPSDSKTYLQQTKIDSQMHQGEEVYIEQNVNTEEEKTVTQETGDSAFVTWMKEDWLLKLGGVLVLMGVLFFLSLAFTAVGPLGKVSIGYLFGITLMLFGFKYAKNNLVGGSAIHVIGAVVILITTYLARQPEYNLFNPYVAAMLMLLTSTCVALTAYAYDKAELAHVGLFLAVTVPMLTNTENGSFVEVLLYLGIVTLGTLWLALVTKWRTLVLLALGAVCFYTLIKISGAPNQTDLSFTENYLLAGFSILFYVTSLFSILRSGGVTKPADGAVAALNAGLILTLVTAQALPEVAPIILAFVSLVYAAGFFFVYKITDVYTSFVVYGGVSIGLLTTAVMLQLSGRSEAVALILIGAGVTVFTHYLSKDEKITKLVAVFNLLPLVYVFKYVLVISSVIHFKSQAYLNTNMTSEFQRAADVWKDVMIVLLATAVYVSLYRYFSSRVKDLWQVSLFTCFVLSVIAVWQILHLSIGGGFATFLSIVIYTIVGLTVLFKGVEEKNDTKIRLAKGWMGLVAARVIFWDAWQVGDVTLGVLICIVIGILLLSSTFILKRVTKA